MDVASLPKPQRPSSLIKVSRWSLLALGFVYGKARYSLLKVKEDELRAKEEAERPAKEAAMKAERDRKNQEEMAYLAQQAGVKGSGGSASGKGGYGGSSSGSGPSPPPPPGPVCECPFCQRKQKDGSSCGCNN